MVNFDFNFIPIFFIALLLLCAYPLYALITGKIISGGKEYSKEKDPRIYWIVLILVFAAGLLVSFLLFLYVI